MSFFLEAKRKTDFQVINNPSPCKDNANLVDYSVNPQRKKSNGYAPFSSTTKLNREAKKPNK